MIDVKPFNSMRLLIFQLREPNFIYKCNFLHEYTNLGTYSYRNDYIFLIETVVTGISLL